MKEGALETGVWETGFRLRSYEVDFRRQATLEALCRRFLDAAWNHAEALGIGYHRLAQQQKFWVLSRLRIEIQRYPGWGEAVTLTTWPRPIEPLFALRHFEILDEAGCQLVGGISAWLVLDARTRRPQRLEKVLPGAWVFPEKCALKGEPEKLPSAPKAEPSLTACARYSDIDVNCHVNSARYIGWLLDSYPLDFQREHTVNRAELNYLAETVAGETLSVSTHPVAPRQFLHSITKEGRQEVCRARLEWKPALAA